jgi:hypothetical protein
MVEQEPQPKNELYCVPCDRVFESRTEHQRLIRPEGWTVKNVPIEDSLSVEVIQEASIEKPAEPTNLPKAKRRKR